MQVIPNMKWGKCDLWGPRRLFLACKEQCPSACVLVFSWVDLPVVCQFHYFACRPEHGACDLFITAKSNRVGELHFWELGIWRYGETDKNQDLVSNRLPLLPF